MKVSSGVKHQPTRAEIKCGEKEHSIKHKYITRYPIIIRETHERNETPSRFFVQ